MQILDEDPQLAGAHAPSESPARNTPIGFRCYLPDGTPLVMTICHKVLLETLFDTEEEQWRGPRDSMEALIVFWLACHGPNDWMVPGGENGMPLYARYNDFLATVQNWAATSCLALMDLDELWRRQCEFWGIQHANKAEPTGNGEGPTPEKAEPAPTGPINTPPSSPEETPLNTNG